MLGHCNWSENDTRGHNIATNAMYNFLQNLKHSQILLKDRRYGVSCWFRVWFKNTWNVI